MSRDEFEELLYYVVELKDKLNAKLDEQCAKINQQGSIINQQGQIVDELCWQLRELSEKVRDLRVENTRLKERLVQICPSCSGCHCEATAYENHVADRYNALVTEEERGAKKQSSPSPSPLSASEEASGKGVAKLSDEGHQEQQQRQQQQQQKMDEYSQVAKKTNGIGGNSNTFKKKWLFGGGGAGAGSTSERKEPAAPVAPKPVPRSNTIWYLDAESIYEPIELSAKPTTRAQLEKISAEVSCIPKPAPRRLYAAAAVDNLALYFGDNSSLAGDEATAAEDDEEGVTLRPTRLKQFSPEGQRGSSKPACSQFSDLEQAYLPVEDSIRAENIVRFTISSRPVTAMPTPSASAAAATVDTRRHAIRSYM